MINILTIVLLPLFLPGLISRVKAIMVGRKGQSLFQQYFHFFKLLRKDEVISTSASFPRARHTLSASRNRDNSPPDAMRVSAPKGAPGFVETSNSTRSVPAGPGSPAAIAVRKRAASSFSGLSSAATAWSSLAHALVMGMQVYRKVVAQNELIGVIMLIVIGVVFIALRPAVLSRERVAEMRA